MSVFSKENTGISIETSRKISTILFQAIEGRKLLNKEYLENKWHVETNQHGACRNFTQS